MHWLCEQDFGITPDLMVHFKRFGVREGEEERLTPDSRSRRAASLASFGLRTSEKCGKRRDGG